MFHIVGPRVQLNEVSSYIDAGFVYGSNIKTADSLRTLESGKLRMLPAFKRFGLKDLLPLKLNFPDEGCIRPNKDIYCFVSGKACLAILINIIVCFSVTLIC